MKKNIFALCTLLLLFVLSFTACKKDKEPVPTPIPTTTNNSLNGLGSQLGYPSGTQYVLPSAIQLVSEIRGGQFYKNSTVDKVKYQGPFPINLVPKSWISYGTGTYVQLCMKLYNTLAVDTILIFPGGLIFCDSLDSDTSNGEFQKGFILQNDTIIMAAHDTAFVCLEAYCLNAHLSGSYYDAVYYIGPVTNNTNLNQVVTIMSTKLYPFGSESDIQSIVWNITDYGQNITQQELQYLNALP